ncbi:MAG TPA: hypothetical protein VFO11_04935, partial [Candidatus Polarisedimenticolaceae bacterium]|nr:hypothetical protein [Candidatus Polarisedimenticolaceae bacterium]
MHMRRPVLLLGLLLAGGCVSSPSRPPAARYDWILRGGTVYDGTGGPGRATDVGIRGDRVAAVGDLAAASATHTLDARGLAVAPGFINMLSWAPDALMED